MIKAVIDNNIWIKFLTTDNIALQSILNAVIDRKASIQISEELLNDLGKKLRKAIKAKKISKKDAVNFIRIIEELFSFHKEIPMKFDILKPQYEHYIDLCVSSNTRYLIYDKYENMKKADGFKEINVIDFNSFIKNIEY